MRKVIMLLGLGLGGLSLACGAAPGADDGGGGATAEDADHGEQVGTVEQGLNSCLTQAVEWNQAWYPSGFALRLQPSGSHVCALQRVQGKYQGGGESLRVYIDPNDGFWYLQGASQQSGVDGRASCVKRSCFVGNSPNSNWLSGEGRIESLFPGNGGCIQAGFAMFWGDAATLLTGFSGKFQGRGESIRVFQSPNPNTSSSLLANSCGGDAIAYGYSYFVGTPGGTTHPKFWGLGEYTVDAGLQPLQLDLAPTNQAFCYFSEIGGKFDGGGEWVSLDVVLSGGGEVWRLATGGLTSALLQRPYARARCMMYNQRQ